MGFFFCFSAFDYLVCTTLGTVGTRKILFEGLLISEFVCGVFLVCCVVVFLWAGVSGWWGVWFERPQTLISLLVSLTALVRMVPDDVAN